MKNLKFFPFLLFSIFTCYLSAQDVQLKKDITAKEIAHIQGVFGHIAESDQKYRGYLQYQTTDDKIIASIDSLLNNVGIEEGLGYAKSLNLSLPKEINDSISALQIQLDYQNHLMIRGIWEVYGYIPKSIIDEKNYVQHLLLLHPPGQWDVRKFQQDYAELLIEEVKIGRMPAKLYASFYDNMLAKILKEPQLYGTNQQFDAALGKVLPPIIKNLDEANAARTAIGMPILKEGEYRLAE